MAALEQQERVFENPFISVLDDVLRVERELVNGAWTDGEPMVGKITSEDVWRILKISPERRVQQTLVELRGDALKQLGWKWKQRRINGKPTGVYVKGEEPYRRIAVDDSDRIPIAYYETVKAAGTNTK